MASHGPFYFLQFVLYYWSCPLPSDFGASAPLEHLASDKYTLKFVLNIFWAILEKSSKYTLFL